MTAVRSEINTSGTHCIDANVVLRLLTAPEHRAVADLWAEFVAADVTIVAPTLLSHELANALHQQCRIARLLAERASNLFDVALRLPIALHGGPRLHLRALELAGEHNLSATYDAHYLALAERFRAPLWTGDRRLTNKLHGDVPVVHLVP